MSFTGTLAAVQKELENSIKDDSALDDMIDPKGEGTVTIPVGLYFQLLGIVTWLAVPEAEEADGDKPS
ncbi:MAG: hypothetical protein QQN63_00410 [Nitrosopumilus sp.]